MTPPITGKQPGDSVQVSWPVAWPSGQKPVPIGETQTTVRRKEEERLPLSREATVTAASLLWVTYSLILTV
jgi:hypothetical protein